MKPFNKELLSTNKGLKPEDLKVGQRVRIITHSEIERVITIVKISSEYVSFTPTIGGANMINFRKFNEGTSATKEIYETV